MLTWFLSQALIWILQINKEIKLLQLYLIITFLIVYETISPATPLHVIEGERLIKCHVISLKASKSSYVLFIFLLSVVSSPLFRNSYQAVCLIRFWTEKRVHFISVSTLLQRMMLRKFLSSTASKYGRHLCTDIIRSLSSDMCWDNESYRTLHWPSFNVSR